MTVIKNHLKIVMTRREKLIQGFKQLYKRKAKQEYLSNDKILDVF